MRIWRLNVMHYIERNRIFYLLGYGNKLLTNGETNLKLHIYRWEKESDK